MSLFFAVAQVATADDKVVFSKPAENPSDKETSPQPEPSSAGPKRWSISVYNAPHPGGSIQSPNSGPAPVYYQNASPASQEEMNKRKNWPLLTPEQILGVETPEQVLGLSDSKEDSKLSLEERFLLRQNKTTDASRKPDHAGVVFSNNGLFPTGDTKQNPYTSESRNENGQRDIRMAEWNNKPGFLNRDANGMNPSGDDRKPGGFWSSVFAQPSAPKQTPEQMADMERFRSSLDSGPAPAKTEMPVNNSSYNFSTPAQGSSIRVSREQSDFNPAGRAAVQVQDNISRPTGIQPLPSVVTKPVSAPAKRPTWQAQLPPWMSDKPQSPSVVHGF